MGLGLAKNNGEEFLPSFRFNAVSGDAVIAGRKQMPDGSYEKYENEVKFPAKFIFDFENIQVGYMHFPASGPSFAMVKIGERMPEKPTPEHKQGFCVKLYSKSMGVSLFSNSSRTIGEVMDTLHDQYLKEEKANANKVPVVEIKGVKKVAVKTKEGSKNYKQPEWSIVSWVARPEELTEKVAQPQEAVTVDSEDDF